MKKNKYGFTLIETLIVSTVVAGSLIYLFLQISKINSNYDNLFKYDSVESIYHTSEVASYLNSIGYEELIDTLHSSELGYVNITTDTGTTTGSNKYYKDLLSKIGAKQAIFTYENYDVLKNSLATIPIDEEIKRYINSMESENQIDTYRIVIEFKDNKVASVKLGESKISYICRKATSLSNNTGSIPTLENPFIPGSEYVCNPGDGVERNFYVLSDNSDTVDLIMDKNIGENTLFSKQITSTRADVAIPYLYEQTSSWQKVMVSLPTKEQILKAAGEINPPKNFDTYLFSYGVVSDSTKNLSELFTGENTYAWLYNYTNSCSSYGCDKNLNSTNGYWTSSLSLNSSDSTKNSSYTVYPGIIKLTNLSDAEAIKNIGIRPVITVSKTLIN